MLEAVMSTKTPGRVASRVTALLVMMAATLGVLASPASAAVPGQPYLFDWYEAPGEAGAVWNAPASDGGKPITAYRLEVVETGLVFEATPSELEIVEGYYGAYVYGLLSGDDYTFRIQARNADGLGTAAEVVLSPNGCVNTPYYDVLPSNLFCEDIAWVTLNGIAQGTDTGFELRYKPGSPVSRQAMAAFVHRLFGDEPSTLTEPFFADVGPSHPFYDDIQWMGETGLSTGTPQAGGKPLYKPGSKVSREAMAAFLHRAAGDEPSTLTEPFFADVGPSNIFYDDIQWMGESGVSTGTPQAGGKPLYKPGSNVSREAMAAFLHRFALLPEAEVTADAEASAGAAATESSRTTTADDAVPEGVDDVVVVPGASAPAGRIAVP
jgi:opacity protein-like surface antigen